MRLASLLFFSFFLSFFSFVISHPAQAVVMTSGDLIKASHQSVYYYAEDGRRYVFPNERIYQTWYNDFSSVKTISDDALAQIRIGGTVTYRPGLRLVKITTDPKVYAVAHGGVLRWIPNEVVARSLYGDEWAGLVDDLPDGLFANYRLGVDISALAPFSPSNELAQATTINQEKQLLPSPSIIPPSPSSPTTTQTLPPSGSTTSSVNTPGYSGTLQILNDDGQLVSGARLNLFASAAPSGGIQSIKLFSNERLVQTCTDSPCRLLFSTDSSTTVQTFYFRAEFVWLGGAHASVTNTTALAPNSRSQLILLTVPPEVLPRQNYVISAVVNNSFDARQTTIFVDGVAVYYCRGVQQCDYHLQAGTATGTSHRVSILAEDNLGAQLQSETKTIHIVSNAHPTIRIAPGQTVLSQGGTVIVEATGLDDEGIAFTEILLDGTVLKRCNASSCQTTAGPFNEAKIIQFTGHTQDLAGLDGYATSSSVIIQ